MPPLRLPPVVEVKILYPQISRDPPTPKIAHYVIIYYVIYVIENVESAKFAA
jgi:hypothetical protein